MPATPGSCDSIYAKLACEIECDERFHCSRCGGPADRCAEAGFVRCECPEEHGFPCHDPRSFGECSGSSEIAAAIRPFASAIQAATVALVDEDGTMSVEAHGGTAAGPVSAASSFRIASLTKSFVAALVMLLVEDGRIGLDASAAAYGVSDLPPSITIRQLLRHESGLRDYVPIMLAQGDAHIPRAPLELVQMGLPAGSAGTHSYSNTGYAALGMIVESVTGDTLDQLLATRLLRPLSLDSMYLEGSEMGARPVPGVFLTPTGFASGEGFFHPANAWAAGALVGTAEDLVRWLRALFVDRSVLSDASLADVLAGIPNPTLPGTDYGLGFSLSRDRRRVWHTGQYPRAGCTAFGIDTVTGRTVAVLTNTEDRPASCYAASEIAGVLMGW